MRSVNGTQGVARLVQIGQAPTALATGLVEALRARCDTDSMLMPPRVLQRGDAVRLTTGPFADFVASVEALAPDQRVTVLMEFMGSLKRVQIAADAVTPV